MNDRRIEQPKTDSLFREETVKPVDGHGKIHIGTSGYSFNDWKGVFYPQKLKREQWLSYYARHFSAVEINATYYRTLQPAAFQKMVDRTPDDFEFWVKVPGQVTHTDEDFTGTIDQFQQSVKPLKEAGKLKGFLAQFPFSFRRGEKTFKRIARLHEAVRGETLAVEFRNRDWIVDETIKFLTELNIVTVTVDLPRLPALPGMESHFTGPVSYVRFHGRNSRTWYNSHLGDRYDYEYSPAELKEWLPRIIRPDEEGSATYLFFNNCHAGQAVKSARMLRDMLELEFKKQL
ncbi:DUF72 domain-containing protein [bacterium]|nr:DUF72 domain-containing protein [bacterium]